MSRTDHRMLSYAISLSSRDCLSSTSKTFDRSVLNAFWLILLSFNSPFLLAWLVSQHSVYNQQSYDQKA